MSASIRSFFILVADTIAGVFSQLFDSLLQQSVVQ